jgi:Ubiquitin-conjugating enzyme
MENVRLRRLKADYEALRRLVRLHPRVELEGVSGNPPDRYRLILRVASLRERGEVIEPAAEHRLEISLPLGYPRDAPMFRMLTPVFHPNIAPHAVCIGDHWSAAETLDHLVQRVVEMLAFQSYNIKSPLNGRAAQWVEEHRDRLPVDAGEIFVALGGGEEERRQSSASAAQSAARACSNCGAGPSSAGSGAPGALALCRAQHALCDDCHVTCSRCARVLCLICGERSCSQCSNSAVLTLAELTYGRPSSDGIT